MSSLLCVDNKNLIACPKRTIISFSFASCKNVCTCSRPGCLVIVFFLKVSFLLFFLFSFVIVYDFWFFFLVVSVLLVWVFWVWALWIWIFYDSVFLACVNKLWEIWYFFDLFLYYFATGFFITMQTTIGVSTSPLICFAHAYCMQSALQDLP